MKMKLLAVVVLAVVGVGAVVYAAGGLTTGTASAIEYLTSTAAVGDVTEDVAATGSLAPASRTGVAFGVDPFIVDDTDGPTSPVTYPVTEVAVEVGDTVTEGQALATADASALRRDLEAARNDLRSAQVSLRTAQDALEDAEDDDVTSQIRQAKISLYAAENQVATARQAVRDLQDQIAGATLTAPAAGLVTEVNVAPGFDAPTGAAIVIDSPTYEVTTDVVESDLADIQVGQTAAIAIDAVGAELTGTVTAISPTASADSGSGVVSYPVTVTIENAPATVRSGMSAEVTITIASAEDVLTVPASALRGQDGDYRVMTLGADGTPVATPVEVGLVTDTAAEITSGLTEGTAVVTGTASDLAGTTNANGGAFGPGGGVVGVPGDGPVFRQGGPGTDAQP